MCLAAAQVLLGVRSEHHWLRVCHARLGHLFPYLPKRPGYHKRLKAAAPLLAAALVLGTEAVPGHHPGRDASGLVPGQPEDRRARGGRRLLAHAARTGALRPGLTLIGDKGFAGREFENLVTAGYQMYLVRPDRRDEVPRHGSVGWIRQWIESVNDTLKGQLDLERHGGRTTGGLYARIAQRLLAMAAAIWHNWATSQPVKRSLTAYDH